MVLTLYCGGGSFGRACWLQDLTARASRESGRRSAREDAWSARCKAKLFDLVTTIGLEALGFHRPARKPWRRKRRSTMDATATPQTIEQPDAIEKRLFDLFYRAAGEINLKGDLDGACAATIAELRALGKEHPHAFAKAIGSDIARRSRRDYLCRLAEKAEALGPKNGLLFRARMEAIRLHLLDLEAELLGDQPSTALRLAVELAVYAYQDFWLTELAAIAQERENDLTYQRRRNWAQSRLLKALRTVEQIRAASSPRRRITVEQIG